VVVHRRKEEKNGKQQNRFKEGLRDPVEVNQRGTLAKSGRTNNVSMSLVRRAYIYGQYESM